MAHHCTQNESTTSDAIQSSHHERLRTIQKARYRREAVIIYARIKHDKSTIAKWFERQTPSNKNLILRELMDELQRDEQEREQSQT